MDMSDMSMTSSMGGMASTGTASAAAATSTADMAMDMGGMGMGNDCKISMLWNWNTIDSCFLSEQWHITSKGMFAGSCIGVICLVLCLEFLRRSAKEYDRFLLRTHRASFAAAEPEEVRSDSDGVDSPVNKAPNASIRTPRGRVTPFRPSVTQQAVRALLHMLQFAVAYFIMLLAMYYNGYIIICIFIGAYIGSFIFGWETFGNVDERSEVTFCCG